MSIAQPNKDRKHFHITDNTQGVLTLRFMPIPVNIDCLMDNLSMPQRRRRLLLREKTLVDEELRYLDGVGSGTLAEVVGNTPEIEAVLD